jgi:hypothetical protein
MAPLPQRSVGSDVDDVALAWELAASACPHLGRVQNDAIYIQLGIGETFDAIDALISALVVHQIPISAALAARTVHWLDSYRGQLAEPRLRQMLTELTTHPSDQRQTSPRTTNPAHSDEVA